MSNLEEPDYQVLQSELNIEIRFYKPMIIAEVNVEGIRKDAIRDGFRLIADYIFGNNTIQMDLTAKSQVEQKNGQKIPMTAPVQQQSTGKSWQISFVMPSKYTIDSLPEPKNDRVKLKEILSKKFIVIQFSGKISNENLAEHEKQLMNYIKAKDFKTYGSPKYAFYNPPWTLPFMRRNEVMLEINKQ